MNKNISGDFQICISVPLSFNSPSLYAPATLLKKDFMVGFLQNFTEHFHFIENLRAIISEHILRSYKLKITEYFSSSVILTFS